MILTYDRGAMTPADWQRVLPALDIPKMRNVDRALVLIFDDLCRELKTEVLVTSTTDGQHSEKSWHYRGLAIDFMLPSKQLSDLPNIFFTVSRYPFTGIGVYRDWRLSKKHPMSGGFHVELPPRNRRALWLFAANSYKEISIQHLNTYFLEK